MDVRSNINGPVVYRVLLVVPFIFRWSKLVGGRFVVHDFFISSSWRYMKHLLEVIHCSILRTFSSVEKAALFLDHIVSSWRLVLSILANYGLVSPWAYRFLFEIFLIDSLL